MSINKRYDSWGHRYARSLSHEIEMNEIHTAIDCLILVKYSRLSNWCLLILCTSVRSCNSSIVQTWHKWGLLRSIRTTTKMYIENLLSIEISPKSQMFFCTPPKHNQNQNWVFSLNQNLIWALHLNQNLHCVSGLYRKPQICCITPKSERNFHLCKYFNQNHSKTNVHHQKTSLGSNTLRL